MILLLALLHVYEKLQDVMFEKKCMPHTQPFFKQSSTSIQWKVIQEQHIGTYKEEEIYARDFSGWTNLFVFCKKMTNKSGQSLQANCWITYGGVFKYKCNGDTIICELYIQSHSLMPVVVVDAFG
jgi:hypothetical protein